jgi:hypothetical protein
MNLKGVISNSSFSSFCFSVLATAFLILDKTSFYIKDGHVERYGDQVFYVPCVSRDLCSQSSQSTFCLCIIVSTFSSHRFYCFLINQQQSMCLLNCHNIAAVTMHSCICTYEYMLCMYLRVRIISAYTHDRLCTWMTLNSTSNTRLLIYVFLCTFLSICTGA